MAIWLDKNILEPVESMWWASGPRSGFTLLPGAAGMSGDIYIFFSTLPWRHIFDLHDGKGLLAPSGLRQRSCSMFYNGQDRPPRRNDSSPNAQVVRLETEGQRGTERLEIIPPRCGT